MYKDYLNHAIIELTSQCNLKCIHCYNWWKQSGKCHVDFNSYKKAIKLLDYLIQDTTVERVAFTGGEPTLSERFTELVMYAKINGLKVNVITNGNGDKDIYQDLVLLNTNVIQFSIHSKYPEIHDRITGVPGSHEKLRNNLNLVLNSNSKAVPVIVISSLNYPTIMETVEWLYETGFSRIMINRYNLGGEGMNHQTGLLNTATELRLLFAELNTWAERKEIHLISGVCTPYCLLKPSDYPAIRFGNCSFSVYARPLTFDIDGNVRLCNHSPVYAGNIYKESLSDIFSNDYVNSWNDLNIPKCHLCQHLSECKGGCRAASEQAGLSLKCPDPIIQELNIKCFTH